MKGFRPLGQLAQHQQRLAQGRRLLLDTAGIGEDQIAAAHQVDEGEVVQRLGEMDAAGLAEQLDHRPANVGIEVDRIDNLEIGETLDQIAQRKAGVV